MTDSDPNRVVMLALVWVLLLAPVFPIGVAWAGVGRGLMKSGGRGRVQLVLLALLTLSQLLLVAGLLWTDVLGPDHSQRRFVTLWVNLLAMAASTVVAARTGGPGKRERVTAAALLTCAWLYALVVSSAV